MENGITIEVWARAIINTGVLFFIFCSVFGTIVVVGAKLGIPYWVAYYKEKPMAHRGVAVSLVHIVALLLLKSTLN